MKAPEPLVVTDRAGKLCMNDEMARCLASVSEPLVVVSIVGNYRTGKSYLLNRLMGKQSGFPLGSTIESKTKGIWVWLRRHPYDPRRVILLMDTEGLADPVKGDQSHDVSIFSLAILMSGMFVYNSKGTIDNKAINELHFTTEMTEHIKVKAVGEQDADDLGRVTPVFVWAVRDFSLDLEIDGKEVTSNDYLEHSLKMIKGLSKSVADANNVKKSIRDFFKERYCFTFPAPVDTEKLKHLDTLPESDLKESFREAGTNFSEFVFNFAKTKEIEGTNMNGRLFIRLLQSYLDAMRKGAVPCIESAVNYVAKTENSKALEKAMKTYDAEMERLAYPVTEEELNKCNQEAQTKCIGVFTNETIFDKDQEFQVALGKTLAEKSKAYIQKNDDASEELCRRTIRDLYNNTSNQVKRGYFLKPGGYKEYQKQIEKLKADYKRRPNKGTMADRVLHVFLQEKQAEEKQILEADKLVTASKKRIAEEESRRRNADMQRRQKEQELYRSKRQQEEMRRNHENAMKLYERDMNEKMERKLNQLRNTLENEKEENERFLREGFAKEASALHNKMGELQNTISQIESSKNEMRLDFDRRLEEAMKHEKTARDNALQISRLQSQLNESRSRNDQLESFSKQLQRQHERETLNVQQFAQQQQARHRRETEQMLASHRREISNIQSQSQKKKDSSCSLM